MTTETPHDLSGDVPCPHPECRYLAAQHGPWSCCTPVVVHAVASNWDAYSFGHGGGHVAFLTVCPTCGRIDRGHVLGVEWSADDLARAKALADEGRRKVDGAPMP